jgi:hypothetical protein
LALPPLRHSSRDHSELVQLGRWNADPRLAMIEALRLHGFGGRIAVAAQHAIDVAGLRGAGADLVLLPFQDAADQAVDLILRGERPPRLLVEAEQEDQKGTVS